FQLGGFNSDIKFLTTNQYATAPMTISNANQSVGIGTNAPNRKLTVEANTSSDGVMTVRNASTAGFAGTYFESGDTWDGYVGYVGSGNWVEPNSFQVGANNRDIKFVTTNSTLTAAMTIKTSNQSVGIGNSNPDYKLSVYHGSKGVEIRNTNAGANSWEFYHDSGTNQLQLRTATGTSVGHFDYNSGAYMATSDRKLKRDIQPIATILPSIMRLMPVNYHYDTDEDQKKHIGFIAQEVEDIFPELISAPAENADKDAIYRMNYTGFGVIAIKAIQEQQNIIEKQQEIIEKQQAKLDAIEKALNKAGIYLEE
ncbi:MAG: tail fiber domain-containing protein, partial [Chitinophagales bacterium]|nr:tail fiber domain-containing protein [Chitinophagales bacterium]